MSFVGFLWFEGERGCVCVCVCVWENWRGLWGRGGEEMEGGREMARSEEKGRDMLEAWTLLLGAFLC